MCIVLTFRTNILQCVKFALGFSGFPAVIIYYITPGTKNKYFLYRCHTYIAVILLL